MGCKIVAVLQLVAGLVDEGRGQYRLVRDGFARLLVEEGGNIGGALQDLVPLVLPALGNAPQQGEKAHPPVHVLGRVVGAAVEGVQVGREEDRHGPAALAGEPHHGGHVDVIEIRPFLPIDLNTDEVLREKLGNLLALEGFVLHNMAPVAGGVADGEENGLVLVPRFLKGFLAPGKPLHGVVGVLEQVGTRLVDEVVDIQGLGVIVAHEGTPEGVKKLKSTGGFGLRVGVGAPVSATPHHNILAECLVSVRCWSSLVCPAFQTCLQFEHTFDLIVFVECLTADFRRFFIVADGFQRFSTDRKVSRTAVWTFTSAHGELACALEFARHHQDFGV